MTRMDMKPEMPALQKLGDVLLRSIRGGDIACRYGGEEFLLILPDTPLETTAHRARELLYRVRTTPIFYKEHTFHITISLGVAAFPEHSTKAHTMVEIVDAALYQAKEHGRNQVVVAPVKKS